MNFQQCPSRAPTFEEHEWETFMNPQQPLPNTPDIKIKDLKSFTKLCNLSSPTVKKWLNNQPVYKSTIIKLERALNYSNLTKADLQKMRRQNHKEKPLTFPEFNDNNYDFPSLEPRQIIIQSHYVVNNDLFYLCQLQPNTPYEPIHNTLLTTYNDKNAIVNYWESLI